MFCDMTLSLSFCDGKILIFLFLFLTVVIICLQLKFHLLLVHLVDPVSLIHIYQAVDIY